LTKSAKITYDAEVETQRELTENSPARLLGGSILLDKSNENMKLTDNLQVDSKTAILKAPSPRLLYKNLNPVRYPKLFSKEKYQINNSRMLENKITEEPTKEMTSYQS
jgi:hypothetical protein